MLLLDVNVVLAAQRVDHSHHAQVRPWFDRLLAGDEPFCVPSMVWGSFLRLSTHRRVFHTPTPREQAFSFIAATVSQPHHLPVEPGARHLTLLRAACDEGDATGDLVPDAVLVALALEHACTIATLDRDFARFPSVRTVRPGAG